VSGRTRLAGLLALAVTLAACFDVPLSPGGEVAVDEKVLGDWHCVPDTEPPSEDRADMRVARNGDLEYAVEWREGDALTKYRAYGSSLRGTVLINVQETTTDSKWSTKDWAIVRYALDSTGRLVLRQVRDDALHGKDDAEKVEEIRRRAADDDLFQRWAVCTRRPAGTAPTPTPAP
jgi:hypothetical protein